MRQYDALHRALYAVRNQGGAILILSFMVLIAMVSMVGSYLYTTSAVTKSAGFGMVDDKTLWLSEAGLAKAIWNLMTPTGSGGQGENWTTAGTTESLGDGSYTMVVERWDFALASNGSTASASSSASGFPASNAIDGNDTTYWQSNSAPTLPSPQFITIAFPYTLTINKVRFLVPAGFRTPHIYIWRVSTNGASFTTVSAGFNSSMQSDITNTFTASANVNYLRLVVFTNNSGGGSNRVRIATLEAIGSKITSTGTMTGSGETITRTLSQTVVADDGSPQNQVAYDEPDWSGN